MPSVSDAQNVSRRGTLTYMVSRPLLYQNLELQSSIARVSSEIKGERGQGSFRGD